MQSILSKAAPVWRCLALVVLAQVLADSVLFAADDLPVAARLISYAAASVPVAFLLLPLRDKPLSIAALLAWSALAGAGAALVMLLRASDFPHIPHILNLAFGVSTLVLLLGSLSGLLTILLHNPLRAQRNVLVLSLLAAATPLWLGPLAEHLTERPALINSIIAASPLSYLAVMAEYDLLRSAWFYQHSPLGGLRYAYPPAMPFTAAYMLLSAFLLLARGLLATAGQQQPPKPYQTIHTVEEHTP